MTSVQLAQERDFLNQLDCPHCHTGASVGIDKAWESSLEPGTLNVKWICKAKVNGMSCDFRKWERIAIPREIEKPFLAPPTKTGSSIFGDCPRCLEKSQTLHDYKGEKVCVRCCTELWRLSETNSGLSCDPVNGPNRPIKVKAILECPLCTEKCDRLYQIDQGWACSVCKSFCDNQAEEKELLRRFKKQVSE